jgi:hypothetical protein
MRICGLLKLSTEVVDIVAWYEGGSTENLRPREDPPKGENPVTGVDDTAGCVDDVRALPKRTMWFFWLVWILAWPKGAPDPLRRHGKCCG